MVLIKAEGKQAGDTAFRQVAFRLQHGIRLDTPPPGSACVPLRPLPSSSPPTLMGFRELILGTRERGAQLGALIMMQISVGGSIGGDEIPSLCVTPLSQIYPCSAGAGATLPPADSALGT